MTAAMVAASIVVISDATVSAAQAQVGCPSVNFTEARNIETGLFASGAAVGDFNLDGWPDIAVSNQNASKVSILLNDRRGGFGEKTDLPLSGPPRRIAAADLNQDGKLDLILPLQEKNVVAILSGDGAGHFGEPTTIPVEGGPFMPAAADFNADGKLDLAVTTLSATSRKLAVLLRTGVGTFGPPAYYGPFGNDPVALGVEDFNADGKLDIAVGGGTNSPPNMNNLSVLLGDGRGNFGAPAHFTVGQAPQSMSIADFNGDRISDISISNGLPVEGDSTVSVLLGNGKGGFGDRTPLSIGIVARGTGAADFNGDGHVDLVVANNGSNTVSVLLGDGTGRFAAKTDFAVGKGPRKLAVGDFNRDGRPDIAIPNTGSNDVSILLNDCKR